MAKIIEESENLKLDRMATVTTDRGTEYVINVDKAICALAELLCEMKNDSHFGWQTDAWYYDADFGKVAQCATLSTT